MHRAQRVLFVIIIAGSVIGCHDGPLYSMKTINPFFLREWAADEKLGPTDFKRRKELQQLVVTMPRLPEAEQRQWLGQINAILENDKNAEMRTLAIRALEGYGGEEAIVTCEKHLNDESPKVRMACCDVLGTKTTDRSYQILAETIGSESNDDVQVAAIRAIGKHRSERATQLLKEPLESRNPAIRFASVQALQSSTGKSLGDDPATWVAYLNGDPIEEKQDGGFSSQLGRFF